MAVLAEIIKDRQIEGIDSGLLEATAERDPVDVYGDVKQKGKPANSTCGPPTKSVTISKGVASDRGMKLFAHTTDDDPVGGPAEAEPLGIVKRWFH